MLILILSLLVLPFIVFLLFEMSKKELWAPKVKLPNTTILLEELGLFHSQDHKDDDTLKVTHLKKHRGLWAYHYDGKMPTPIDSASWRQLSTPFIRYKKRYWVNSHWIKRMGPGELELYNGARIPDRE